MLRKAMPKNAEFAFLPPTVTKVFFPSLVTDLGLRDKDANISELARALQDTKYVEWDVRGIYYVATSTSADAIWRIASVGSLCVQDPPIQGLSGQKYAMLRDALVRVLHRFLLPAEYSASSIPHDAALQDGHVLAVITALSMALATGRLDLAVAGLFGAGKTRAVAVLYAALLAVEPQLKLAAVCKEDNAACAMANLLVSLNLPNEVYRLIIRAPGSKEYKKEANRTPLDVEPKRRRKAYGEAGLVIATGGLMLADMVFIGLICVIFVTTFMLPTLMRRNSMERIPRSARWRHYSVIAS